MEVLPLKKRLVEFRDSHGYTMKDMARLLCQGRDTSWLHYESKSYKRDYLPPHIIKKMIEKLVPEGVAEEEIYALASARPSTASTKKVREADLALISILQAIIRVVIANDSARMTTLNEILSSLQKDYHESDCFVAEKLILLLQDDVKANPHGLSAPMLRQIVKLASAGLV